MPAIDYKTRRARISEAIKQHNISKNKGVSFEYKPFSVKQKQVLTWWLPASPVKDKDGIIADGAIRAGKTVALSLSFGLWAMNMFNNQNFLICGKTIGALRRNVIKDWKKQMAAQGFSVHDRLSDNIITIRYSNISNDFYLFGGSDERSQDLVQGITAAGALLDEVALMPKSFVDQVVGRCSVAGSKFWFNCNPSYPRHWFKTEYIDKLSDNIEKTDDTDLQSNIQLKNILRLQFTMDDNLSLDEKVKERYKSMFTGVFYRRFILGQWCAADGLIYDSFDEQIHTYSEEPKIRGEVRRYISVDYGTSNPMCFLEILDDGDIARVNSEYYYSSKEKGRQKTDAEYADDFVEFAGSRDNVMWVVVDPSAASFKTELQKKGYRVKDADNSVRDGISKVSTMFALGKLLINKKCKYLISELLGYVWDEKAIEHGEERPVKVADHACDALRYGISTVIFKIWRFMKQKNMEET